MIEGRSGGGPDELHQSAKHILNVEGGGGNSLDLEVLQALLGPRIRVRALGSSQDIQGAARSLFSVHPDWYFLIDRDHQTDAFVEKFWEEFPNPVTCNLLVWRRRELENYFIIPEYATKSEYLKVSEDQLRGTILHCCRKRLFFDAANQVVILIREQFKAKWVEQFPRVTEFPSREAALAKLAGLPELAAKRKATSKLLSQRQVSKLFSEVLDGLTGGTERLEYGCGRWLELLKGKGVLPTVVNRCFRVVDAGGRVLQCPKSVNEVAKELVRKRLADQPQDFQGLVNLIRAKVKAT